MILFFFFSSRRRHTRLQGDWSSDVCSSDLNKEITLKLKVEISSLAGQVSAGGGLTQPIIGTREIDTTIRLKDQETNLLAGLIREEERKSMSGLPGLSSIPVVRRIFGNTETNIQQTDIVLTLTPHIIRIPDDVRRQGEHDVGLLDVGLGDAEDSTHHRYAGQSREAAHRLAFLLADEAGEQVGLLVLETDGGVDLARADDRLRQAAAGGDLPGQGRGFHLELQGDLLVVG